MRAAVFLDRDGTLIEDRGHLSRPSDAVFYPDTIPALRLLQERFLLFIVTHQGGISRGLVTADEVDAVNRAVTDRLESFGIHIEAVYCCPHDRTDGCRCIKPNPYFVESAAREFGLDLSRSFTIGDHPHDEALGRNSGATGIYVLTGHGRKHVAELSPDCIVANGIDDAAVRMVWDSWMRDQGNAGTETAIAQAARFITDGGIVAFPTETVYGLGASAFDVSAAARVFEAKNRPAFDPLIVHVDSVEQAAVCTEEFPDTAQLLADTFWPGPLTLVLRKTGAIPDLVTAGLPTVAVRMPNHPVALELIRQSGVPLAAPSANPFGSLSPTTAEHVAMHLGAKVDAVLDGGACTVGVESTIVSLAGDRPVLLRPGGIPAEAIQRVIGPLGMPVADDEKPEAPGQLPNHYAPRTPLFLTTDPDAPATGRNGLLTFREPEDRRAFAAVEILSPHGSLTEAAANLFAALHQLDALGLDAILAEPLPEQGLGVAINDRLRRAAARI
jgi:L-threonylcarbamoyladenylate synthase